MDELNKYLRRLPAGSIIFRRGEISDQMYFIHSGRVSIQQGLDQAARIITVLDKGDFFGEMALLENIARTADAVTLDDVVLIEVGPAQFHKLIQSNVEIAVRMLRKYIARLRQLEASKSDSQSTPELVVRDVSSMPVWAHLVLCHNHEVSFELTALETIVGRSDPVTGIEPDIDCSDIDPEKSISRRHARIVIDHDQCFVIEEVGVTNGTEVNRILLRPGQPMVVNDGDIVSLAGLDFLFKRLVA